MLPEENPTATENLLLQLAIISAAVSRSKKNSPLLLYLAQKSR